MIINNNNKGIYYTDMLCSGVSKYDEIFIYLFFIIIPLSMVGKGLPSSSSIGPDFVPQFIKKEAESSRHCRVSILSYLDFNPTQHATYMTSPVLFFVKKSLWIPLRHGGS